MSLFTIGLTDHLEGPRDIRRRRSLTKWRTWSGWPISLGVQYAWFSEHHAHAHHGHLPTPLLFALHLAGQTRQIRLGTAIICLNLHHPLDVAEQVAVADLLTEGGQRSDSAAAARPRSSACSASPRRMTTSATPASTRRCGSFARHGAKAESAASGSGTSESPRYFSRSAAPAAAAPGSRPAAPLLGCGEQPRLGTHRRDAQFQHALLPPADAGAVPAIPSPPTAQAGGTGLVAANRPVFVGPDDETAFARAEPALRILWRRFRQEGKIPADCWSPTAELCAGTRSTSSSADRSRSRERRELHNEVPFDVANVEVRWAGLTHELVRDSLRRLMEEIADRPIAGSDRAPARRRLQLSDPP